MSTDTTFRNFTAQQAAAYASGRGGSYPQPLYETILDFHQGSRDLCMDVGTGPGKAVWDLLNYSTHCIGVDASAQMIEHAKLESRSRHLNHRTTFLTTEPEHCGDPTRLHTAGFNPNSIDLLTVAMAAHWFQFPTFYPPRRPSAQTRRHPRPLDHESLLLPPLPAGGIGKSRLSSIPLKTKR
ncbi:hypothetical protein D0860_07779 [Hortaea werneckii]|uniref:Methyltransferase type 11 domain-containing protein n=1 Tax=Hortaea werneckii TaxID=91943 RepID=A0A3M7GJ96_HORWE|nr:hypothetical protein D0860_07779 [Hortaea werneckii]